MYKRHIFGKKGEDLAEEYLKENNYEILERNFLCKQGEIDIIAKDKNYLVFVEIKARTSKEYGLPAESVTEKKIKHILYAANYYLYINNVKNVNIRIDVIEIFSKDGKYYLNHLKQVI